ncbi:MAG: class I SAM-dependent RNA methyltransferase [Ignavibacteriae bacterium]|nr:class I SAM-dependent RNA methyltransferase [Ignavibacteriota bacterium]
MKNEKTSQSFIAKTPFGLEEILEKELINIGAKDVSKLVRAVKFNADLKILYKANLALRTSFRILKPIFEFKAHNAEQLYRKVKEYNWNKLISPNDTIAIDGVVSSEFFKHSKYAALKVKDAIVDQIRDAVGKRPNVELKNPTYRINIHIENNNCSILLDSSGESLHKRGYRKSVGEAPLNEILAAGMIQLSEWDCNTNFVDPMCGSGTLLIEAAMIAKNIAPNFNRIHFGFMNWKDFDKNLFEEVKSELIQNQKKFEHKIIGNDINKNSIENARENIKNANLLNDIILETGDFRNLDFQIEPGIIITNPPYDERIKIDDIKKLYKEFGDTLKQKFTGFDVWILSANSDAMKSIGLRTSKRLHLYNGALESRFYNYKLYEGSLKKKFGEN